MIFSKYSNATLLAFASQAFCTEPVQVDVAIVGGGATGTYAALTLSDMGKSVVVIEAMGQLGGHTSTYVDPKTGTAVDFGVQRYGNTKRSIDFFHRLGVNFTSDPLPVSSNSTAYVDFTTSKPANFAPGANFTAYRQQLNKYPYLLYTTDIPTPVPSDLSLSFGDFVSKYSLSDVAFTLSQLYGLSLLNQTVLTVIAESGLAELGLNSTNTVRIVGGNHQIYDKALKDLSSSVLLNSTVKSASRNSSSISLVVKTPQGDRPVSAKRLLVTIPTTKTNMAPFAPDSKEEALFTQFSGPGLWIGIVRIAGLQAATQYTNVGTNTPYRIPALPGIASLVPTVIKGAYRFLYFDDIATSSAQAQQRALVYIQQFVNGIAPNSEPAAMLAFDSHTPFKVGLSAQAIQNDGWRMMYDLQGHRATWYTGLQFLAGSTQLWNYTSTLIPQIVKGL